MPENFFFGKVSDWRLETLLKTEFDQTLFFLESWKEHCRQILEITQKLVFL